MFQMPMSLQYESEEVVFAVLAPSTFIVVLKSDAQAENSLNESRKYFKFPENYLLLSPEGPCTVVRLIINIVQIPGANGISNNTYYSCILICRHMHTRINVTCQVQP